MNYIHPLFGKEIIGIIDTLEVIKEHNNLAKFTLEGSDKAYFYFRRNCSKRGFGLREGDPVKFVALDFTLAKGLEWLDTSLEMEDGRTKPSRYKWTRVNKTVDETFAFGIGRDLKKRIEAAQANELAELLLSQFIKNKGWDDVSKLLELRKKSRFGELEAFAEGLELSQDEKEMALSKSRDIVFKASLDQLNEMDIAIYGNLGCGEFLNSRFVDTSGKTVNEDAGNYFFRYKIKRTNKPPVEKYVYYLLGSPIVEYLQGTTPKDKAIFCQIGEEDLGGTSKSVKKRINKLVDKMTNDDKAALSYNDEEGLSLLVVNGHYYPVSKNWE